jgi:hypothetical protein
MAKKDKLKAPASRVLNQTKAKAQIEDHGEDALAFALRANLRANLMRVHPFLRKAFRPLKESELNSEEVFFELFPNDKAVDLYKLRAVYELQR